MISKEETIRRPRPDFYDHGNSDNVCCLCGQPNYRNLYEIKHFGFSFRFKQCHCGLIKQTPMPNEQFFYWFFNSKLFYSAKETKSEKIWGFYDYFRDEPSRLATSRYRYKKLRQIFEGKKTLNVMKVGPSTGTFLYVAKQNGHHVIGCDVSSQFSKYAKDNYGIQIDIGRFENMTYKDGQFDVILLFNVIENIPNQVEFLEAVRRKLKPGGYLVINFVDMQNNLVAKLQREKYFLYRPPICYIYTMSVMEKVLDKFGFQIVSSYRDIRYMTPEKILTLLDWQLSLKFCNLFQIQHISIPVYAYPSRILVAQRD